MSSIRLKGIAVRPGQRAELRLLQQCEVTCEEGLAGDHQSRPGSRQVTVLSDESWLDTCRDLGIELPWQTRRANLLLSGYRFGWEDQGKHLRIGELILKITRETMPCRRMDELHEGLMGFLNQDWRGGVCCRVIRDGVIRVGDPIEIIDTAPDAG